MDHKLCKDKETSSLATKQPYRYCEKKHCKMDELFQ